MDGCSLDDLKTIKIWYADGNFKKGKWENLPSENVQIVVIYFNKTDSLKQPLRSIASGFDYYFIQDNMLYATDDIKETNSSVKFGSLISNDLYERITLKSLEEHSA